MTITLSVQKERFKVILSSLSEYKIYSSEEKIIPEQVNQIVSFLSSLTSFFEGNLCFCYETDPIFLSNLLLHFIDKMSFPHIFKFSMKAFRIWIQNITTIPLKKIILIDDFLDLLKNSFSFPSFDSPHELLDEHIDYFSDMMYVLSCLFSEIPESLNIFVSDYMTPMNSFIKEIWKTQMYSYSFCNDFILFFYKFSSSPTVYNDFQVYSKKQFETLLYFAFYCCKNYSFQNVENSSLIEKLFSFFDYNIFNTLILNTERDEIIQALNSIEIDSPQHRSQIITYYLFMLYYKFKNINFMFSLSDEEKFFFINDIDEYHLLNLVKTKTSLVVPYFHFLSSCGIHLKTALIFANYDHFSDLILSICEQGSTCEKNALLEFFLVLPANAKDYLVFFLMNDQYRDFFGHFISSNFDTDIFELLDHTLDVLDILCSLSREDYHNTNNQTLHEILCSFFINFSIIDEINENEFLQNSSGIFNIYHKAEIVKSNLVATLTNGSEEKCLPSNKMSFSQSNFVKK